MDTFGFHFIVKRTGAYANAGLGPYIDPSYGTVFSNASDFELHSIAGYLQLLFVGTEPHLKVRLPGGGTGVSLIP
jgi:hypothetical protein